MAGIRVSVLLAAMLHLFWTTPAKADFLDFIAGDTIEDTTNRVDSLLQKYSNRLLGKTDEYVLRLENLVADTLKDGFDRTDSLRKKVLLDLQQLESDIVADLQKLVFEAECAALRTAKEAPKDAIKTSIQEIKTANPSLDIKIFDRWRIVSGELNIPDDPSGSYSINPDVAYYLFKKDLIKDLEEKYKGPNAESMSAYPIYSTLLSISALARKTSCFFPGVESTERRFLKEHANLAYRASVWDDIVNVKFAQ